MKKVKQKNKNLEKSSKANDLKEKEINESDKQEMKPSLESFSLKNVKAQKTKKLIEKLKKVESDNLYLRAEFENFKKRSLEEKFRALRYEGEKFISTLATEVLDDLERALFVSKQNKSLEDLQKGLEMIHKKTNKLLNQFGVEVLDPTGKAFDPSCQEALSFVKTSKVPEDHVLETYKKAYKMHDKIIRPAQVIVAKEK
ncbi:MAG: nucleotide exchange factor GrpE [Bdellovibrionaceae bacterium]|nr:nucleotide exchange factor GrpE [Pseudobdellovibrionaceae bacterium]